MSESNSYGFGGKLIGAVFLALLGGYVWACVEEGRSPLAILSVFSSKEVPEPAKPAPVAKKEVKPVDPAPPRKADPVKPAEPVTAKKPEPPPVAAGPRMYSAIDMTILFNETDDLVRRGKFFEARNKIANTSRIQVPQESLTKRLLQSVWQKHRILISLGAVLVLLLLTIIIQNPVKATVDLLWWTVSMRQGVSLAFLFVIGWSCGWVTRSLYSRGLLGE